MSLNNFIALWAVFATFALLFTFLAWMDERKENKAKIKAMEAKLRQMRHK